MAVTVARGAKNQTSCSESSEFKSLKLAFFLPLDLKFGSAFLATSSNLLIWQTDHIGPLRLTAGHTYLFKAKLQLNKKWTLALPEALSPCIFNV